MPLTSQAPPIIAQVVESLVARKFLKPAEGAFLTGKYHLPHELAQVLLAKKVVSADELAKTFATVLNMPYVSLDARTIPESVIARVPEAVARARLLVSYQETPTILRLAVAQPYKLRPSATGPLHELARTLNKSVELAVAPHEEVLEVIERYKGFGLPQPAATIQSIDLTKMAISPEVLRKFPLEIVKKYQMIVFEAPAENHIKVAALNPQDPKVIELIDFLKNRNGIKISLYKTTKEGIASAIAAYELEIEPQKKATPSVPSTPSPAMAPLQPLAAKPSLPAPTKPTIVEAPPTVEDSNLDQLLGKPVQTLEQLKQEVKSGFIPRLVGAILAYATFLKASDIHLEPAKEDLRLRYRVDGDLREILKIPLGLHPPIVSRIKILAQMKIDEKRIPQDGRFEIKVGGHEIDIRAASLPTIFDEKLVLRLLNKSAGKLTFQEIGLSGRNLQIVEQEIAKPWGIVFATGPTGSGKTTTLYSILQKIATAKINVITLEDPVEYEVSGVNQSQVKPKIGFSFAEGLRSVLRQDPNVIMVGEIRDRETAELATQAALTGHLVLTTLHTNDAPSAIPRLINIGVEPFLITSALNCVISQRLVRKLCPQCRKPLTLIPAQLKSEIAVLMAGVSQFDIAKASFYGPVGCGNCTGGYLGRIGIFEVLTMSAELEAAALSRRPASEIEAIARRQGMTAMRQDGILKAVAGITSLDEVWKATTQ